MNLRKNLLFLLIVSGLFLFACSPKIFGTVQLVDQNMKPIVGESPEGTVINMINTSAKLEEASYSVTADKEGKFESEEGAIKKGDYKVEAGRMGYITETLTAEIGKALDIKLKKIPEGKRKSIESAESDEDKIINPGEVNIQPPML